MKKLLLLIALLTLSFTLSGCSNEKGTIVPSVMDYEECRHIAGMQSWSTGSYKCDDDSLAYEVYQDYANVDTEEYYTKAEVEALIKDVLQDYLLIEHAEMGIELRWDHLDEILIDIDDRLDDLEIK